MHNIRLLIHKSCKIYTFNRHWKEILIILLSKMEVLYSEEFFTCGQHSLWNEKKTFPRITQLFWISCWQKKLYWSLVHSVTQKAYPPQLTAVESSWQFEFHPVLFCHPCKHTLFDRHHAGRCAEEFPQLIIYLQSLTCLFVNSQRNGDTAKMFISSALCLLLLPP